ncbi:MAG: caspase family protein [Bacteroidota bacterium]
MKITKEFSKAYLALLIWAINWLGLGGAEAQQTWSSPRIQVRFAEIPRPKLPARLVISDMVFSDRVGGNGNSMLDAEEKVVVSFKLTNEGQGEAYKTRLNLKALHTFSGITYAPVQDLGDFKPGASQVFRVELSAARSIPTAEARFELSVSEGNGFDADPADLRFPTQAFKSPLLALADAVFSSKSGGNLVLGEPLALDFVVQNRGQGVAKSVRLRVNRVNEPENIFLMGDEEFDLGNLAPNESKKLRYEFLTNKKYSLKEIKLELVASEEYKEYGFRKVEKVGLDAVLAARQNLEVTGRKDAEIAITDVSLVSDVDRNIPYVEARNPHRYALIIGNEDYATHQVGIQTESNVAFARNDARSFKLYCERTLGVPAANIEFITDATAARTKQALDKLYKIIQAEQGKAEVLVYYAGHGLPLENTKEPYLIPVDVSGADPSMGISLSDMYSRLSQFPSKRVVVFLDACFSGGSRGTQLLAMRAVRIKADGAPVSGNLMVFSASSDEESALPWTEKQHGFFTYHLLKKLQESQGMVTYESLADYLRKEVRLQALKVSGKDQNPQFLASPDLSPEWTQWTIR